MNRDADRSFIPTCLACVSLLVLFATAAVGCGDLFGSDAELVSVAYGDGKFVAVGYRQGSSAEDEPPEDNVLVAVSNDGKSWRTIALDDRATLRDVAYGNGKFVAVGRRVIGFGGFAPSYELRILTSTDGVSWKRADGAPEEGALDDITYGNGTFVATASGNIMLSTDGEDWEFIPNRDLIGTEGFAFVDEEFVAWGSGDSVFRSSDGVSWTEETADGVRDIWHLSWVNGQWLGAGATGINRPYQPNADGPLVLRSADLSNWSTTASPFSKQLPRDFAYGAGDYVSVFHEQGPMTSTDGASWNSTGGDDAIGTEVIFAEGKFVTVGPDGVFTSSDGKSWKQRLEMDEF